MIAEGKPAVFTVQPHQQTLIFKQSDENSEAENNYFGSFNPKLLAW